MNYTDPSGHRRNGRDKPASEWLSEDVYEYLAGLVENDAFWEWMEAHGISVERTVDGFIRFAQEQYAYFKTTAGAYARRDVANGGLGDPGVFAADVYVTRILKRPFCPDCDSAIVSANLDAAEIWFVGTAAATAIMTGSWKRWQAGDPVNYPTNRDGKYPHWDTVKRRYWKNRAMNAEPGEFSNANLRRMRSGRAPRHGELDVEMELHHINGRSGPDPHNPENLREMWPWEHADIDPHRYYNGPRP